MDQEKEDINLDIEEEEKEEELGKGKVYDFWFKRFKWQDLSKPGAIESLKYYCQVMSNFLRPRDIKDIVENERISQLYLTKE